MPRLKYLTKHMAYIFLQVLHQFFLFSAQREEHIATRLPRLQKSHKSKHVKLSAPKWLQLLGSRFAYVLTFSDC